MLLGNSLKIIHKAITDRPTVLNLTNHSYFQLDSSEEINHYNLRLDCDSYLETKPDLLPTGRILDIQGAPFDFRETRAIGETRFDTPFLVRSGSNTVASVFSDISGIRLTVSSNQPAVVVYTPLEFAAICFETQNAPDAPNFNNFPSSRLNPGETYTNEAIFTFDLVT